MFKIILPIHLQKDLNFYFSNAFPLCVLMTDPQYSNLVFEHYLEPFGMSLEAGHLEMGFLDGFQYGDVDCLDTRIFRCIELQSEFIDWSNPFFQIEYMLNQGYYVVAFVDEYYLPDNQEEQFHFVHEYLIYGTDSTSVYVIGFNDRGQFDKMIFNKVHFIDALSHANEYIDQRPVCKWIHDKQLIFMKTTPREYEYPLRPYVIKEKLDEYFCGSADEKDILLRITGDELKRKITEQSVVIQAYGRKTKYAVADHLYKQIENIGNNSPLALNFQCIHMYKEQCNLALKRAKKISDTYDLKSYINELQSDLKKAEIARLLCLKTKLQVENTDSIISLIQHMIEILLKQ